MKFSCIIYDVTICINRHGINFYDAYVHVIHHIIRDLHKLASH